MTRPSQKASKMSRSTLSSGGVVLLSTSLLAACTGILGSDDDSKKNASDRNGSNSGPDIGTSGFPDPDNITSPYSPLAQLTADEYVSALAHLLRMPTDDVRNSPMRVVLAPDPASEGLLNAANRQRVTQLGISGYAALSRSVASDFLGDVDVDGYRERLDCAALGDGAADYSPGQCTRDFGEQLMRRGYRGAFEDADLGRLDTLMVGVDGVIADSDLSEGDALKRRFQVLVELIGMSPKFVLMIEHGNESPDSNSRILSQREVATRMAFLLTGGPPDDALLNSSESLNLHTAEGRVALAEQLLLPENAQGSVDVLVRWLGIDDRADQDSINQLRAFLEDWIIQDLPFSDLYSAPFPVDYIDGTVADEPFGVLGSKAVIASNTSSPTPSFINRGEFITARLLCAQLPQDLPDAALEVDAPTPLEVFEIHDKSACATCHHVFDNYGAALQRFDVDSILYDPEADWLGSSFDLKEIGDVSGSVSGAAELGSVMGASAQAQACMTKLWYRHAIRRDLLNNGDDDEKVLAIAEQWTNESDTSLRSLLRIIVADENFARLLVP